jgi:ABC-type nitrate/sulfonate/bicarbonate transport system permease component
MEMSERIAQPAAARPSGSLSRIARDAGPSLLLILLFITAWEAATRVLDIHPVVLPSPSRIFETMIQDRVLLYENMLVTFWEIVLGFAIGFTAGFVLALLIAYSPILERSLYPIVVGSQTIPVFAIAPLLIIWFGFGIWPKALIAALIVFFPITVNGVEGLRSAEPESIDLLRSLSATNWQIFRLVQLPSAVPYLIAGTQVAIPYAVIGAVIGEWVGASQGIGHLMLASHSMLRTDRVFAAIVVLSFVALFLFSTMALLSKAIMRRKHLV